MVEAICHCGAVRLEIASPPQTVTQCNCSICRKLGALWAYYSPAEVQVTGATDFYLRRDRKLEFHRCRLCGCTSHWSAPDKNYDRMGINARLLQPAVLAAVRVRHLDGAGSGKYLD